MTAYVQEIWILARLWSSSSPTSRKRIKMLGVGQSRSSSPNSSGEIRRRSGERFVHKWHSTIRQINSGWGHQLRSSFFSFFFQAIRRQRANRKWIFIFSVSELWRGGVSQFLKSFSFSSQPNLCVLDFDRNELLRKCVSQNQVKNKQTQTPVMFTNILDYLSFLSLFLKKQKAYAIWWKLPSVWNRMRNRTDEISSWNILCSCVCVGGGFFFGIALGCVRYSVV